MSCCVGVLPASEDKCFAARLVTLFITLSKRAPMDVFDFGLNLGYLLSAIALVMRDMLALRALSALSGLVLLLCDLFLVSPASRDWFGLFWSVLFLVINVLQLTLLLWERRPITFNRAERDLHASVFPNLSRAEFTKLKRLAQWRDGKPGTLLAIQGKPVTEIVVLYRGTASIDRDGASLKAIGDGAIIGQVGALVEQPFSSTIRLTCVSRYVVWQKASLDRLFGRNPSMGTAFERAFILGLEAAPAFRERPLRTS
jgi:hypothetical protein